MNPLLLGGAALVALFALSGSSSASASQDQMVFKDYMWTTTLPATVPTPPGGAEPVLISALKAGQWPAPSPLAAQLPAPPNSSPTGGRWAHYPNGWGRSYSGTPTVVQVFPHCPGTVDVYAWIPNFSWKPSQPNTLQVTKINGYWVTMAPEQMSVIPGPNGPQGHWGPAAGWPPPPPGGGPGHWFMRAPGYCVWLTSANSNSGELAAYNFNLGLAAAGIPAPASMPISATPAPAVL